VLQAHARRIGHQPEDARDLTQEFFLQVLRRDYLSGYDHQRSELRTFLFTLFKRFLSKEHAKARTLKRGGNRKGISLDWGPESDRVGWALADWHTPETELETRCMNQLLDHALDRLRVEFSHRGKAALFDALDPLLEGAGRRHAYHQISRQLHIPASRARVTVFRMRQRLRTLLLEELRAINGAASDLGNREDYWRILFRRPEATALRAGLNGVRAIVAGWR
jgi:RNA polymerase sigma-70 factor (ECF subfamily)